MIQKGIFHKTAIDSDMIRLSVGTAVPIGHDVAGTARGPIASHDLSKVEQVIL